jgi:hypothetical protein
VKARVVSAASSPGCSEGLKLGTTTRQSVLHSIDCARFGPRDKYASMPDCLEPRLFIHSVTTPISPISPLHYTYTCSH